MEAAFAKSNHFFLNDQNLNNMYRKNHCNNIHHNHICKIDEFGSFDLDSETKQIQSLRKLYYLLWVKNLTVS